MALHTTTRRGFLISGTTAVVGSAGCLGIADPGDESRRDLELTLSRWDGSLRDRYVVDLSETRPAWSEAAFEATLDGSAYTTQYRKPFFATEDSPRYTRSEGTFYELGSAVVDEERELRPVLRLYDVESDAGDSTPSGVASDRLPDRDQRAVEIAHMAARARDNEGGVPWGLVQRGGYVYRDEAAIESSRLLSEDSPEHVLFRERWYAVEITEEAFHEPVYRATVEPVTTSAERMESILRARLVDARIARDDLSGDARDVLLAAEHEGYGESHPFSAGYREVLRGLDERAYLDGNIEKDAFTDERGAGVLSYDGDYFDYYLRFVSDSP